MELLTFFRLEPDRVFLVPDRLPRAGNIGKLVEGIYQGYRDYLNNHASHSSFSTYSLKHLEVVDNLKLLPNYFENTLKRNLTDLYLMLMLFAFESVNAIQVHPEADASILGAALEVNREMAKSFLGERKKDTQNGLMQ